MSEQRDRPWTHAMPTAGTWKVRWTWPEHGVSSVNGFEFDACELQAEFSRARRAGAVPSVVEPIGATE
jgi:hypothetical protein